MRSVYSAIKVGSSERGGGDVSPSCWSRTLVGPLLRLPLGDCHGRIGDRRRVGPVEREVDVLEPLVVVALREVEAELRAARLLALQRPDDDALRAVEHVAELDRSQDVLIEDRALVVDRRGL